MAALWRHGRQACALAPRVLAPSRALLPMAPRTAPLGTHTRTFCSSVFLRNPIFQTISSPCNKASAFPSPLLRSVMAIQECGLKSPARQVWRHKRLGMDLIGHKQDVGFVYLSSFFSILFDICSLHNLVSSSFFKKE